MNLSSFSKKRLARRGGLCPRYNLVSYRYLSDIRVAAILEKCPRKRFPVARAANLKDDCAQHFGTQSEM
jgi:hypothetical protein